MHTSTAHVPYRLLDERRDARVVQFIVKIDGGSPLDVRIALLWDHSRDVRLDTLACALFFTHPKLIQHVVGLRVHQCAVDVWVTSPAHAPAIKAALTRLILPATSDPNWRVNEPRVVAALPADGCWVDRKSLAQDDPLLAAPTGQLLGCRPLPAKGGAR
jgi:hypothetical protein